MQSDLVVVYFISALAYNTVEINKTHSKRPQKKVSIQLEPLRQYMKDMSVAKKLIFCKKADIRPDIVPGDQYQSQVMLLLSKTMTHNMTNNFPFHYYQ